MGVQNNFYNHENFDLCLLSIVIKKDSRGTILEKSYDYLKIFLSLS